MNQAILFNDDIHFSQQYKQWCFSVMLSGEKTWVVIYSQFTEQAIISTEVKFDWEMLVEDWLEDNEPEAGVIYLKG